MEIWKDIKGYEGVYQISNLGRVKSLKFKNEKILKPNLTTSGYYSVHFMKNRIKKPYTIHRLVARHFLNEIEKFEVNHIDRNKLNNRYDNLEFISHSDNVKHTYLTGRKKQKKFINGRTKFIIDLETGIFYSFSDFYNYANISRKRLKRFVEKYSRYNFV